MYFTQEDYKKIEEYLKQNSKKDTDFGLLDKIFAEDYITFVHKGQNYIIKMQDLREAILENFIKDAQAEIVLPITDPLDDKYKNITDELYTMINSLQISGIALSNFFGDREDIGITQKTLTKLVGKFLDILSDLTGKTYMDFKLTVQPTYVYQETPLTIGITADCTEAISDFDSIQLYVNDELIAESHGTSVFTRSYVINETSTIKAVGVILGKTITKTVTAVKEVPFFIGSGNTYTDVTVPECAQKLEGTLEGDYNMRVKNDGEYIFVIIPLSRKEEFRRCKMDMNGIEIPFEESETSDYIVCKSVNTYQAGTYNIDIDINT